MQHEERTTTLYSHHIFLFPFKWKADKSVKDLRPLLEKSWKRQTGFDLKTISDYNEYNYFYDFVRPILYDLDDSSLAEKKQDDTYLDHYVHLLPKVNGVVPKENRIYHIEVKDKTYELNVDANGILLHLYSSGVGVLSFHLSNRKEDQATLPDILAINQYGRRIFPPFFTIPSEKIGYQSAFDYSNFEEGFEKSQGNELAHAIWIGDDTNKEDFKKYKQPEHFKKKPFQLPSFISNLFPPGFLSSETITDSFKIFPVLDDRMFVICWYGDDGLTEELKKPKQLPLLEIKSQKKLAEILLREKPEYGYLTNPHWYEYIFVDKYNGKSCQNDEQTIELLRGATNARWGNYGTFYGASRYSFVCLTPTYASLKEYNFVIHHVQTLYYKMVELVLLQRACLLHFSDKVTAISSKLGINEERLSEDVSDLYQEYIRFVNKIYFREVTAQDQGIELYNLLQAQMNIAENVTALDGEIKELHDYVSLKEEKRRNDTLDKIAKWGAAFAVAGLIISFFGMNYFGGDSILLSPTSTWANGHQVISVVIVLVFSLAAAFYSYGKFTKK